MVTILNTSILTAYGSYWYEPISVADAKRLLLDGFESAVGHQSTCDIISKLLGISVPMNRVNYTQKIGDMALIFKLKSRPEEGKILTAEEIEAIGYELGVIERTA